jgi:RNA polymerase sigma factor (sigma-70 family)
MNNDELVLNNINLIYIVMKKLNIYNELDEWYDVGLVALVKACKSYDYSKGYKPSTYLYRCIYNAYLMEFRKKRINSISIETSTNEKQKIIDLLKDDMDIENDLIKSEIFNELHNAISRLDNKEQFVINITYGLNGYDVKEYTQIELSEMLKISQAQISRIKNRAIKKLKIMLKEWGNG